ncbi:hypothetical protein KQI63_03735 [bacterium]|nr:hypothetical protein [bacterium]
MSRLLVDAAARPIAYPWSLAGLVWVLTHISILLFGGDPNALTISSLAGLVTAMAASLSHAVDRPRMHAAAPPFLLFALVMLGSYLMPGFEDPGPMVIHGWILFGMGLLVPIWLLREERMLHGSVVALLLLGAILALRSILLDLPASWVLPRSHLESSVPLLTYRYAAYATVQLLIVATAIPWVVASGRKVAYFAALPLAVIVYSVASLAFELPEWLRYMPDAHATWEVMMPFVWYQPVALLALLWVLIGYGRVTLKERSRWRKFGWRSGVLLGGWLSGLLVVAALFYLPLPAYPWVMTAGGLLCGLGFAARESIIRDDETRHPRRRLTPLLGILEEAWIIVRSFSAAVWRILLFRTPQNTVPTPPRYLIDGGSDRLHAPYEEGRPRWVPVVMHMHTNRWEGAFTASEMVDHYAKLGAGSVILTEHNRIADSGHTHGGILAYEHGWGPHNHHVLVLGATRTRSERYPFGGSLAGRAETIERLRADSKMLILAHPSNKSWCAEAATTMDYDALELFNKSIDDFEPWDHALTAGLLVWGTAGDDCHDLRSRHQTGKRYLLVDLREGTNLERKRAPDPDKVLQAMRTGRFIAVRHLSREITRALPNEELPMIEEFRWKANKLNIEFDRVVNYAETIGPGGEVLAIHKQSKSFKLYPRKGRGYCRLVIYHGNHTIALNPVARIDEDADLLAL